MSLAASFAQLVAQLAAPWKKEKVNAVQSRAYPRSSQLPTQHTKKSVKHQSETYNL
jgi:hypothetical protein